MMTDAAVLAFVLRLVDGEVVDVWPYGGVRQFPEARGECRRAIGQYTACATCKSGTWAYYGREPLCRTCAWQRWKTERLEGLAPVRTTDQDATLEALG